MKDGKKAKLMLLSAQAIVTIIACCIIIILSVYKGDNTYFYFLIPIFISNAISASIYFADDIIKNNK